MFTPHHIKIAQRVLEDINTHFNLELDTAAFVHDNVLPDFNLHYLRIPHNLDGSRQVIRQLDILSQKIPGPGYAEGSGVSGSIALSRVSARCPDSDLKHLSEVLGILCHYISDSFCYAHSLSFNRNLLEHHRYEIGLYRQLKHSGFAAIAEQPELPALPVSEDLPILEILYDRYCASAPSMLLDIRYSYLASWTVLYAILSHGLSGTPEKKAA